VRFMESEVAQWHRSLYSNFLWDLWKMKWHRSLFSNFLDFSLGNHFYHCSIPIHFCPLWCVTAVTRQQIVVSSVYRVVHYLSDLSPRLCAE
jgi:hypothetical protein